MIRTRLLHGVARIALRVTSPLKAAAIVRGVGHCLPAYRDRDAAARDSVALGPSGTCLSRAMAVAARYPGARIAIGVDPARSGPLAHAWVEVDGAPLGDHDVSISIIAAI